MATVMLDEPHRNFSSFVHRNYGKRLTYRVPVAIDCSF